ncbi:MAG: type IV-A pilus assembly ATPase PilB [Desulfobacterales bacterium CG23_combo_of_CG06-09_8_20_14_all_52_9]|nr:MAG: type IV-A pilus assembly ATPase PilB [Desulfobacterales bacterium CG23_combo_of_CG06-09_8_20_14_all_52_9]
MNRPLKKPIPLRTDAAKSTSLRATVRDQSGAGKTKIGEILSKEGQINHNQLKHAVDYQQKHGGMLSHILLRLRYIEEDTILNLLSRSYNYPPIRSQQLNPEKDVLQLLSYETAKAHMAFPVSLKEETLRVAMVEPTDTALVESLQAAVKRNLSIGVCTEKEILEAFKTHYKISDEEYKQYFDLAKDDEDEEAVKVVEDFGSLVSEAEGEIEMQSVREDVEEKEAFLANDAPIIKLVNGILVKAITDGISDIHIEPFEHSLQVRYRLDGALFRSMNLPITIKSAITSRVKILSGLDIAERRLPQDGRIKMNIGKKKNVDIRVSILPTLFGESIVMRILDRSQLNVDLTRLGFELDTFKSIQRCISRPYGLLLVTGPTGSGKTTTLYSILNALNTEDTKILTVEDPVEFNFRGINQVLVREKIGLTFAAALRSFLRQDPDVIMIGEIRDLETAEIAIKAAMTGHLVFATVHTNDAPSTISRLVDIGIPSYMLASSVTMVLSQRLIRRLCPKCKVEVDNKDAEELEALGFSKDEIPDLKIYRPKGCAACNGAGYKGRVGLYELMEVTDDVEKAINANLPEDQLRKISIREGMLTLRDVGLNKIREGVTSVEEVARNTAITKESLPDYLVNPNIEEYQDREVIIREGNTDKDFFMLVKGALYVVKGGKIISQIVQPGEYFGEMSAVTGDPRSATIISNKRSTVKRYPGDKIPDIIENHPNVAKHLFEVMANRLNHADRQIYRLLTEKGRSEYSKRQ